MNSDLDVASDGADYGSEDEWPDTDSDFSDSESDAANDEENCDADFSTSSSQVFRRQLLDASQRILKSTSLAYDGQVKQFKSWLETSKIWGSSKNKPFFSSTPHEDAPLVIVEWFMECGAPTPVNGAAVSLDRCRVSYSLLEKRRAALLREFAVGCNLGRTPWHLEDGRWVGNPVLSDRVTDCLYSIKRSKVRAGEIPRSSKALDEATIQDIFAYNHQGGLTDHEAYEKERRALGRSRVPGKPASPRERLQAFAFLLFTFVFVLRGKDVAALTFGDIQYWSGGDDGTPVSISLQLKWHKGDQLGKKSRGDPFRVWQLPPEQAHRCVVRALGAYVKAAGLDSNDPKAPVFPKIEGFDVVGECPLTPARYLSTLRLFLGEVGRDPLSYGVHCGRRGGSQFLFDKLRWPIRKVAKWGGWSLENGYGTIMSVGTIFSILWEGMPPAALSAIAAAIVVETRFGMAENLRESFG